MTSFQFVQSYFHFAFKTISPCLDNGGNDHAQCGAARAQLGAEHRLGGGGVLCTQSLDDDIEVGLRDGSLLAEGDPHHRQPGEGGLLEDEVNVLP